MKKVVWVLAVIGVLFVGSLSVEAETYTLGTIPALIGWAEYRVADVMGFWKKQGVDIKLIDYTNVDIQNAVVNRRFDLTPLPMTVVVSYMERGADLLYLGTLSRAYQHKYLIIKKDLLNKSLKGLTIGNFMSDHANNFLLSIHVTQN